MTVFCTLWDFQLWTPDGAHVTYQRDLATTPYLADVLEHLRLEHSDARIVATPLRSRLAQMAAYAHGVAPTVKYPPEQIAAWVREQIYNPRRLGCLSLGSGMQMPNGAVFVGETGLTLLPDPEPDPCPIACDHPGCRKMCVSPGLHGHFCADHDGAGEIARKKK